MVPTIRLNMPVKFLKGVGERRAEGLERLGIVTAGDLLWHLPHRYLDASSITPLARAGVGQEVACIGKVVTKAVTPTRKGLRIFSVVLRDDSGVLECAWPGQPFLDRTIEVGQTLLVTGQVRFYHGRQLAPREHLVLGDDDDGEGGVGVGRVLPVYPATAGLSHKVIRGLIERHLDALIGASVDLLPASARQRLGLPALAEALRAVHHPQTIEEAERGRQRLAFDELFDLQLMLSRARLLARHTRAGKAFQNRKELTSQLKGSLPWPLTTDQRKAIKEIYADMMASERMHRLLMGDVGTGKTVVALFAMLLALENDYQAALMAPTELLAEQHAATLATLLAPLGIAPVVLTGRLASAEKGTRQQQIAEGSARLIVGTHALLQERVKYHRLGLVVIDEQHRFGVEQRAAFIGKGDGLDVLMLSATPIPRTLALTRYGDLDISVLRERPPGRGIVKTTVRGPKSREQVWDFVATEARAGRQAYVVLPVIEESERTDLRAAVTMAETLQARWSDLQVGLVHGKMPSAERDRVMEEFRCGKVGVLVATTVIEVGVDVPNATNMVIEHPDRFGLAQLHQLRGRIGRGSDGAISHCILLSAGRIPDRLKALARTTDGFKIAELDLAERRFGDLLGARQSGGIEVRTARFPEDTELLLEARKMAAGLLHEDPTMTRAEHLPLRDRAVARYPRGELLFRLG